MHCKFIKEKDVTRAEREEVPAKGSKAEGECSSFLENAGTVRLAVLGAMQDLL